MSFPNILVSIGEGAFTGCSSLAALSLPNILEIIGNSAFAGCQKLGKLSIPKNVTVIMDSAFNACGGLMVVALGERIKAVGNQAFGNCGKLTSITAPANIPYLGSRAVDGNFTDSYNAAGKKGGTYTYSRGFRAWYTGDDPVPQAITLTPGTAFSGSIQSYMQEDWYRLHIPEGGRVIIAHTEGSLDTALILYDRDGEKLDEDDDSGDKYNARVSAFALEGPVYLKVSSYRKGNYSLTATLE